MHYFFLGARRKLVLGASRRVERARGPLVVSCLGVAEWAFAGARPAGLALSWFVLAAALRRGRAFWGASSALRSRRGFDARSEEHTSELQSRGHLVCRLLLEKKKQ